MPIPQMYHDYEMRSTQGIFLQAIFGHRTVNIFPAVKQFSYHRFSVICRHMISPETSTKRNEKRPHIERNHDSVVPIYHPAMGKAAKTNFTISSGISIQNLRTGKVSSSFGSFWSPFSIPVSV